MNNTLSTLRRQAITAVKTGAWDQAVTINQEIVAEDPQDASAFNRLGMAYLQLSQPKEAKAAFEHVLTIDKTNQIARKQLDKIKNNCVVVAPTFSQQSFIEEPGKTKTIELHRLAGRPVLETLSVGQLCELKPKNRYISVEVGNQYVGALPEDISFRLSKLMQTGNVYSCLIYSSADNTCKVYLKEESRSKKNADVHSFPPGKLSAIAAEADERYLFDDESSIDMGDGEDSDEEQPPAEETNDRDYLE